MRSENDGAGSKSHSAILSPSLSAAAENLDPAQIVYG